MLCISSRFAARRLLPAALAVLWTAGAAAAQTSAYGSAPYLNTSAGQTSAHPTQGVVYFEEPLPAPTPLKPVAPPAPVAAPAPILDPAVAPVNGGEMGCSHCSSGGMGGLLRGKCETCGPDSIVPPPLGYYAHSIYMAQGRWPATTSS